MERNMREPHCAEPRRLKKSSATARDLYILKRKYVYTGSWEIQLLTTGTLRKVDDITLNDATGFVQRLPNQVG